MSRETLEIGPHRISVTIEGQGAPLVCVHGSGMSGQVWRRLQARLAQTCESFAPDLIGYGRSSAYDPTVAPAHHTTHDAEVLEAVARRALRDKSPEDKRLGVHLVGHSYGGLLALAVAYRGQVPVRTVVAYEPVAFGVLTEAGDTAGLDAQRAADPDGTAFQLGADGLEGWLRRFIDFWNGAGFWDAMPATAQAPYLAAKHKVYAEVQSLLTEQYDLADYAAIRARVLLLSGAKSPLAARRVCAVLAATIPGAREQCFAGAGHVGPLSHADAVNEAVAAFLAGPGDQATSTPEYDQQESHFY